MLPNTLPDRTKSAESDVESQRIAHGFAVSFFPPILFSVPARRRERFPRWRRTTNTAIAADAVTITVEGLKNHALIGSETAEVIDAALLVPQHRERIYIVGFRDQEDFERFQFPDIRPKTPRLADILEPDVPAKYTLTDHLWRYLQDYAAKHRALGNGFGFGLANLEGVSRTLSARYYKDGSEILIPQRGKNPRRLTPRECARLMGFPDCFEIPVSDTRAYKQFGNSVVVPVIEAIAREMVGALGLPAARAGTLRRWRPTKQMPLHIPPTRGLPRLAVAS